MRIHKLELNFSDFCEYSYISEINFPKKKHIKISVKCSRFVSSINFENRLISYISKHCFLRILTRKKEQSNKIPVLTKSTNMGIWVADT